MAEISAAAYADLRAYVRSNWTRVRVQDAAGAVNQLELTTADPRVAWSGTHPIELTITLKGTDPDVTGKQLGRSLLFKGADTGFAAPYSVESFEPFTVGVEDELVIRHRIEIPDIV